MSFSVTVDLDKATIAVFHCSGALDAAAANDLQTQFEGLFAENAIEKVVLNFGDVQYMSSAGLRVLLAMQRRVKKTFVVGARQSIITTIQMTGMHHVVTLLDSYDAAVIEGE